MSLASNTRLIVCHVFFQGLRSAMIVTSGYCVIVGSRQKDVSCFLAAYESEPQT